MGSRWLDICQVFFCGGGGGVDLNFVNAKKKKERKNEQGIYPAILTAWLIKLHKRSLLLQQQSGQS